MRREHALSIWRCRGGAAEILVHTQQEWWWTRLEEDNDNSGPRSLGHPKPGGIWQHDLRALWRFWSART